MNLLNLIRHSEPRKFGDTGYKSQEQRVYEAIKASKQPRGVTNWELSKIALNYTMRISDLRRDGYNVVAVRDHLPNGRALNTFRYYLIEE